MNARFVLDAIDPEYLESSARAGNSAEWNSPLTSFSPQTFSENQWKETAGLASDLGILLPFSKMLHQQEWFEHIPEKTRIQLAKEVLSTNQKNNLLCHELDIALRTLIQAQIPVVLYGALDLALRVYPVPSFRKATDVELFIPRELLAHSLRALGRVGYRLFAPSNGNHSSLSSKSRVKLCRGQSSAKVVLFTQINLPGEDVETDARLSAVWGRTEEGAYRKKKTSIPTIVRSLAAEDRLCYAVVESMKSGALTQALPLLDMHYIIEHAERSKNINWERAMWEFSRTGCMLPAWFCLSMIEKAWQTPVPSDVISNLNQKVSAIRGRVLSTFTRMDFWFSRWTQGLPPHIRSRMLGLPKASENVSMASDHQELPESSSPNLNFISKRL